jgi:hypothetical protein
MCYPYFPYFLCCRWVEANRHAAQEESDATLPNRIPAILIPYFFLLVDRNTAARGYCGNNHCSLGLAARLAFSQMTP